MQRFSFSLSTCLIFAVVVVGSLRIRVNRELENIPGQSGQDAGLSQAAEDSREKELAESGVTSNAKQLFPVVVRKPLSAPRVELTQADPLGRRASVACSTCHSVRSPDLGNRRAEDLREFHQGMQFRHGDIVCYSCHNQESADQLRLADGTAIDYPEVMQLCSQCHGPQATAFAHGAHGGMNGFWDLSRGPQLRNNCVDCHDPHVPAFPKMIVNFKPRDRFLRSGDAHAANSDDARERHDESE